MRDFGKDFADVVLCFCCGRCCALLASEMAMVKVDRSIIKIGEHRPAKSSSLIYEKNIHR